MLTPGPGTDSRADDAANSAENLSYSRVSVVGRWGVVDVMCLRSESLDHPGKVPQKRLEGEGQAEMIQAAEKKPGWLDQGTEGGRRRRWP